MKNKKLLECIHGVYCKTCNICHDYTEKEIIEENERVLASRKNTSIYECLDAEDVQEVEREIDYDFEPVEIN